MNELSAAGRLSSALGITAVGVAIHLDRLGPLENGTQHAALARALRESLAAALADAKPQGDKVDELGARRDAKLGRARGTA